MCEIKIIKGDLLDTADSIVAHCCNTRNKMNSGVARVLRQRFPEIYAADTEMFNMRPDGLLGRCLIVPVITDPTNTNIKYVANLYGQKNYGYEHIRYLDYEAFYIAMDTLKFNMEDMKLDKLSLPFKIGCGLAGGSWPVVIEMIKEIFNSTKINVTLYEI